MKFVSIKTKINFISHNIRFNNYLKKFYIFILKKYYVIYMSKFAVSKIIGYTQSIKLQHSFKLELKFTFNQYLSRFLKSFNELIIILSD